MIELGHLPRPGAEGTVLIDFPRPIVFTRFHGRTGYLSMLSSYSSAERLAERTGPNTPFSRRWDDFTTRDPPHGCGSRLVQLSGWQLVRALYLHLDRTIYYSNFVLQRREALVRFR